MSRLKIKGDNGWFAAAAGWQAALENSPTGPSSCSFTSLWAPREVPGAFSFASRIWPGRCANRAARLEPISRSSRRGRSAGSGVAPTSMLPCPGDCRPVLALPAQPLGRLAQLHSIGSNPLCGGHRRDVAGASLHPLPILDLGSPAGCPVVPARHRTRGRPPVYFPGLRTQVRLLAQRTPGAAHRFLALLQFRFTGGPRAASFPPAIGLSIKCKCCDWKTLARDRPRLRPERRNLLGKTFPSTTAENQEKRDDVDPQMGELPW